MRTSNSMETLWRIINDKNMLWGIIWAEYIGNFVNIQAWGLLCLLWWRPPHTQGSRTLHYIFYYIIAFVMSLYHEFDSLAPGRSECDSKDGIFNFVLLIVIFRSSHDNARWWMPQDLTDDKSTLVQVMAWCRQATSHYLNQCWPRLHKNKCYTKHRVSM